MKKLITFGFAFFIVFTATPQSFLGTRSAGLLGAELSSPRSILTATNNPASIALLHHLQLEAAISPSPFGLNELKTLTGGIVYPSSVGGIGFVVQNYGFELYSEFQAQAIYGRRIMDSLYIGVSFDYYNLQIRNYGNAATLIANFGMLLPLDRHLTLNFSAHNIAASKIGASGERLPSDFLCGATYTYEQNFTISLALEKETGNHTSISTGISSTLTENVELLAGYRTDPALIGCGLCITYDLVGITYALNKHPELGYTHIFGLSVDFNSLCCP